MSQLNNENITISMRQRSVSKWLGKGLKIGLQIPTRVLFFCPTACPGVYRGALLLEVKRQKREADYSPPFSAEVKNKWSFSSDMLP